MKRLMEAGHRRPNEQGFAMLLVIVMTTVMLAVATMYLDIGLDQKYLSVGVAVSQRTLLMAETGSKWAEGALPSLLYPQGAAGAMDLNGLLALPKLDPNDTMCGSWEDCSRYRLLTQNGPVTFGEGTYRVGVTCYPNACTTTPVTSFETRTEGAIAQGFRAIVEVGYTF